MIWKKSEIFFKKVKIVQDWVLTFSLYSSLFEMIFSPEGVVSSQDYEYQIKAVCTLVSNKNHRFGAAELPYLLAGMSFCAQGKVGVFGPKYP